MMKLELKTFYQKNARKPPKSLVPGSDGMVPSAAA